MVRKLSEAYSSSSEITTINLTHLLVRLEGNILSPSADLKPIQRSQYHRARVSANLEHARTLLLQLERSLPNIKIQSRKHALQTDLGHKRQQIRVLKERLDEIGAQAEAAAEATDYQDFSSDDDEDILPTPDESTPEAMSPQPTKGSDSAGEEEQHTDETGTESLKHIHPTPTFESTQPAEPHGSSTLRSRHQPPGPFTTIDTAATATGTSLPAPAAPSLFPRSPPTTSDPTSKTGATEASLSASRAEQETLTNSLLSLAGELKASSHTFHTSLESEKSVLTRAVEGLDRNTLGMDAAGKRMGMLRRMSEGRGWWGRILMYLWIFGLWIVAVLIVYVGPKLRF
ncbi:hypothetical protein AJ80_06283 [Polytolypa hystricis UAMH7299]|uniref:Synaptobrevin n=1 Tax=Polytolypa hystricis (strain UAMH7299) TaxID=1447883 RepID=A0A2B7XXM2_POLH7|nr:hypothetical protein AJ80_06283 [Polytolypa hystricis UAMH7299]